MITQSSAYDLLFALENILAGFRSDSPQCWACGTGLAGHQLNYIGPDGAITCIRLFAEHAIKMANNPGITLSSQLQAASESFAKMAADCSLNEADFKEKFGPILRTMVRTIEETMLDKKESVTSHTPVVS